MKKLLLFVFMNLILILNAHSQCTIHFVTTTGTPSAAGSMTDPLDITTAFIVAGAGDIIRISDGVYTINQPLNIPADNIVIEGGFLSGENWKKTSLVGSTTISRSSLNPEGVANQQRLVAMYADSKVGFQIHDIFFTTSSASSASSTSYGLHIANCSDYSVVRCKISSGNGASGVNGAAGDPGANSSVGGIGSAGSLDGNCSGGAGGIGGAGAGSGAGTSVAGGLNPAGCDQVGGTGVNGVGSLNYRAGGSGGGGGAGGETDHNGGPGGQGGGVNGGPSQTGQGLGGAWSDPGGDGTNGTGGLNGTPGVTGSNGTLGFLNQFFIPVQGANGGDGQGGKGGAGGGGGGGQSCTFCDDGSGDGGGGGGGGGQGGAGGTGAYGGGGSFGVYLYNNGMNTSFVDCLINNGFGGFGGIGGTGGTAGIGANGGLGSTFGSSEVGTGGNGGKGGNGGAGGAGGSGLAGMANSLQVVGGTVPDVSITTFDLAAQAEIKVDYNNCTANTMSFEATSLPIGIGTASWDFGVNASTQTSLDNPGVTSYSATGWNSITQGAQVYTGFVYISCQGSMQNVNVTICEGETLTVGSSVYSAQGSYTDVLTSVLTGCDSTVNTNLTVNTVNNGINISGATLTAIASSATYIWLNCSTGNNVISGANGQTYVATQNGDYAVIVTQNSCSDTSICMSVSVVGIEENVKDNLFSVFPNPSNGNFTVDFGKNTSNIQIDILDYSGKLIHTITSQDNTKVPVQIKGTTGIYFLRISADNMQEVIKVLKQ